MMHSPANPLSQPCQRGVTIVEILVALVVSMILLGGVLQIFVGNQRTASLYESISRTQENARFASHFLTRDIREAGYQGCGRNLEVFNTLNNEDTAIWDLGVGLEGYDNVGTTLPARLSDTGINPIPGTDVVIVRSPQGEPASISRNNNAAQLFIKQTPNTNRTCDSGSSHSGLCQGDVVVVSDCQKARVFQITNLTPTGSEVNVVHSNANFTPGNRISSWGGASAPDNERFGSDAEIIRMVSRVYFIGESQSGEPALFLRSGQSAPQELVAGVEDMQITYGINNAGDNGVDVYVTADAISSAPPGSTEWKDQWGNVMAVRIALLLRSADAGVLDQPQTFTFDDGTMNPAQMTDFATALAADRRYRQVTEATITLRNRVR